MNVSEKVKRSRTLSDDEIRALWQATKEPKAYHSLLRFLLLSAQRWSKVAAMTPEQIVDGVWTLPKESREKGTVERVQLPQMALDVIDATPQIVGSPLVFAGGVHGRRALEKRRLDARLRELVPDMQPWVHHDLRRTARSLMARAGVPRDHAERVLGHTLPGVEGVYDRHDYAKEKADALAALARMIGDILDPQAASNVVPLRR
jgi:integrase